MNNGAVILAEGLVHTYHDGTRALDGFTLHVAKGERVALVGANGAGKSTFLMHLNGLFQGEGRVEVLGMPVTAPNLAALRRAAGVVFQNPDDQLFCTNVWEDVAFGLRNMGLAEAEIGPRVTEALEAVALPHVAEKSAFHLSTGEKRRVALATVLAMRPEIFLLDEPTSGLDPKCRKEIAALLERVGGTQLIATHDFVLAKTLCTRVVVVYRGQAVAEGAPGDVLEDEVLLERYGLA